MTDRSAGTNLTTDGESWITEKVIDTSIVNFNALWNHAPAETSSVMVYNKDSSAPEWVETKCRRKYGSYMQTPSFNRHIRKSYMFSGSKGDEIHAELPVEFQPLLESINHATGQVHNQVVINWYEAEKDSIPSHSDWTDGLEPGSSISVLTLTPAGQKDEALRKFQLFPRETCTNAVYDSLEIPLTDGLLLTMHGKTQDTYRHGVPKLSDSDAPCRRISMTVRRYRA